MMDTKTLLEIRTLVEASAPSSVILARLKPYRYETLGKQDLERLLVCLVEKDNWLNKQGRIRNGELPDETWYVGPWSSYMDYFTRKLTDRMMDAIRYRAEGSSLVIPNECNIESIGTVGDMKSIVRLKRPAEHAAQDLVSLGVPAGYTFVNMKLQMTYYHHVHLPVSGVIARLFPVTEAQNFFGRNSLWLVQIETNLSPVFMLVVGEFKIQDFDFAVEVGQSVAMLDRLGNFSWGSQTVLLFNPKDYGELQIVERVHYTLGEQIA